MLSQAHVLIRSTWESDQLLGKLPLRPLLLKFSVSNCGNDARPFRQNQHDVHLSIDQASFKLYSHKLGKPPVAASYMHCTVQTLHVTAESVQLKCWTTRNTITVIMPCRNVIPQACSRSLEGSLAICYCSNPDTAARQNSQQ